MVLKQGNPIVEAQDQLHGKAFFLNKVVKVLDMCLSWKKITLEFLIESLHASC